MGGSRQGGTPSVLPGPSGFTCGVGAVPQRGHGSSIRRWASFLERLRQDGLDQNTIVVFMSDHGRAMPRGKQWPYDSGLHIPLIVVWPEGNPEMPPPAGYQRGAVNDQLVSSLDITASTLDWAGVSKPAAMQGRVLFGPHADPPREYLFGGRDRGDETVFHIRNRKRCSVQLSPQPVPGASVLAAESLQGGFLSDSRPLAGPERQTTTRRTSCKLEGRHASDRRALRT